MNASQSLPIRWFPTPQMPRVALPQQQVGVYHPIHTPHLWLERDDAPASRHGLGLTRPVFILFFYWRCDRHCCVDLVGVSLTRS